MQWLAQNWPWIVVAVAAGLFLLERGRRYFENEENRRRFEAAPEDFAKSAQDGRLASSTSRTHRAHRRYDRC